jgi:hypothetical protein
MTVGSSEDQNTYGNVDSKDFAHEASDGKRTLLGTGGEAIPITLWQTTCLHFVHAQRLWDAEFKVDRPIRLMEAISRQPSSQTMV